MRWQPPGCGRYLSHKAAAAAQAAGDLCSRPTGCAAIRPYRGVLEAKGAEFRGLLPRRRALQDVAIICVPALSLVGALLKARRWGLQARCTSYIFRSHQGCSWVPCLTAFASGVGCGPASRPCDAAAADKGGRATSPRTESGRASCRCVGS